MEVLTAEEAEKEPVGLGRSEPNALPKPNRPDVSFSCIKNPFKACKYVICKRHRCKFIIIISVILLILMGVLGVYAFPGYTVKKLLGA